MGRNANFGISDAGPLAGERVDRVDPRDAQSDSQGLDVSPMSILARWPD